MERSKMTREQYEMEREKHVRLAEEAKTRFQLVTTKVEIVKVITLDRMYRVQRELNVKERNLVEVAFGREVYHLQTTRKEAEKTRKCCKDTGTVAIIENRVRTLKMQQNHLCRIMIRLISTRLIGFARSPKSTVLYFKMKGDYLLFFADAEKGEKRNAAIEQSIYAYSYAASVAKDFLGRSSRIRLDLGMFFNTFVSNARVEEAGNEVQWSNFGMGGCWTQFDEKDAFKAEADFDKETLNFLGTSFGNDITLKCLESFQRWSATLIEREKSPGESPG